ncbi:MAG: hypothetical protein KDC76_14045, partial [Bacteroidetes bacterium]|nr:hypothetical protein [Bacteroidota bacterium]
MLITFFTIRIRSHRQLTSTPVALTAVFSILGVAGFTVLMGRQFVNHDYYFIAVFIPFLFLLLGLFLNGMDNRLNQLKSWVKYGVIALGFLAFAASAVFGWRQFRDRSQEVFVWRNRPILNETNWMANGDEALTSLGISPDARIFVCYVFAPNTSLIYFNRQGRIFNHEEMTREPENIEYWLQRIDPQYVIVPAKWNPHLHRDQPDFERELIFFGETETFLVYTRK